MIAAMMTFLFLVSCVLGLAAWLAERGLRGCGLPARFVWLGALLAGPALLAVGALTPSGAPATPAGALPEVVLQLPALVVGGGEVDGPWVDRGLTALWLASLLGVVAFLGWARSRLARDAQSWKSARILGRMVSVSQGLGPAVTGTLRTRIVVPEWVLTLPEPQLRLVLAHEEEHRTARDPAVLAAAVAVVAATAWNPVSWWLLRRLRSAIEIDCDGRVLRWAGDRRAYGESLLTVAARAARPNMPVAAFAEAPHALERRLMAMTSRTSSRTRLAGTALVAAAVLVGVQACSVDSPVGQDGGADGPATSQVPDLSEPTFTPFTEAPEIQNRSEVIEAMQAEYPPLLREAGVGGTVRVYFFIDETGAVGDVRLDQSSGHEALDLAALRVANEYRFRPAENRGQPTPVWVSFPITFVVDGG